MACISCMTRIVCIVFGVGVGYINNASCRDGECWTRNHLRAGRKQTTLRYHDATARSCTKRQVHDWTRLLSLDESLGSGTQVDPQDT